MLCFSGKHWKKSKTFINLSIKIMRGGDQGKARLRLHTQYNTSVQPSMVMHWNTVRTANRMLSKFVIPKLGPGQYSRHSAPPSHSRAGASRPHGKSPTGSASGSTRGEQQTLGSDTHSAPPLLGPRSHPPLLGTRSRPPFLGPRWHPLLLGPRSHPPLLGPAHRQAGIRPHGNPPSTCHHPSLHPHRSLLPPASST